MKMSSNITTQFTCHDPMALPEVLSLDAGVAGGVALCPSHHVILSTPALGWVGMVVHLGLQLYEKFVHHSCLISQIMFTWDYLLFKSNFIKWHQN